MPSASQMLKVHAARAGQIKVLAASRSVTATEALEHLISLAVTAGELPDALPGWEVIRNGDQITLTLDGHAIPAMHERVATMVATNFERAGTELKVGRGVPQPWGYKSPSVPSAYILTVGRHGAGVVVVFEELDEGDQPGEGKRMLATMTRGMAIDLARQIRAA